MEEALSITNTQQGPQLSVSDVGSQVGPVDTGGRVRRFQFSSTVHCWIKIVEAGGNASDVTKTSGIELFAGNTEFYLVPHNGEIGAVCDTGKSGILQYHGV